ncbi:MAG: DNA repair exonuclease [Myxococcales bacterium]|nr:DNA repair exonuclease [Myxococcota bacterium]MDW8283706.1 DNA repair exonuclease [Myxococcales bacterium]
MHSADWQIGKAFRDIATDDGDKAALLRAQRLRTVGRIAQIAAEQAVDAVLVAGDVFDTLAVSDETLRRTLEALAGFCGPWLLLPGNHDPALAESPWTRLQRMGLPPHVHLLTEPRPVLLHHRLAVLPAPLCRRHEAVDVTEILDAMDTPEGAVRVGLAHGSVRSHLPQESEALNPIAPDRAERARLDYLALGDWHGTLQIGPRTWYAGTPEPDRFKDNDAGNVLLVSIDRAGAPPQVQRIPVGHFRWHQLQAQLHCRDDLGALEASLQNLGQPWDRHLLQLSLSGSIDLETGQALEQLLDQWRARFHLLRVQTDQLLQQPGEAELDHLCALGFLRDAVGELRRMQQDPDGAQRQEAQLALQILYAQYRRLQPGLS